MRGAVFPVAGGHARRRKPRGRVIVPGCLLILPAWHSGPATGMSVMSEAQVEGFCKRFQPPGHWAARNARIVVFDRQIRLAGVGGSMITGVKPGYIYFKSRAIFGPYMLPNGQDCPARSDAKAYQSRRRMPGRFWRF